MQFGMKPGVNVISVERFLSNENIERNKVMANWHGTRGSDSCNLLRHRDCPTTVPKILLPQRICAHVRCCVRRASVDFSTPFMKRIAEYFRRCWPPYLWQEIKLLSILVDSAHEALAQKHKQVEELKKQPDEASARAMLLQLRVHQESVRHRTGYMVSAFIPQGVIEKLVHMSTDEQQRFVKAVAEVLVSNAMSGIYKRSQSTNKLTALIFEPITKHGQEAKLVGGIFETDGFVPLTRNPKYKQLTDVK